MFVRFLCKKGQAVSAEYVILITLVLAALGMMTVFVKRALQGRVRDAGMTMVTSVAGTIGDTVVKNVQIEYEPYYVATKSDRDESSYDSVSTGGLYQRAFNMTGSSAELSNQLPPREAQ